MRALALSRRAVVAMAFLLLGPADAAIAQDVRIGTSTVRFASVAEGRAVMLRNDDWAAASSDFQRAATLGVAPPVSVERVLAYSADAVIAWPADQQARWRKALEVVGPRFLALHVPVPPELLLVDTDGRDAAGNPYTRSNAVMMPSASLGMRHGSDVDLLAHEMWHVVSRHSPALASRLYALIGFEPVPLLEWPAAWLPARIANPDAPFDRHAMRVRVDGRDALIMPLLMASRIDLLPGESLFSVLDVRLLEVDVAGGRTRPVLQAGAPVWHAPDAVPDYARKLGGNTGYVIHPEEAMADNIALLVGQGPVRNPALLKRIAAVLAEKR